MAIFNQCQTQVRIHSFYFISIMFIDKRKCFFLNLWSLFRRDLNITKNRWIYSKGNTVSKNRWKKIRSSLTFRRFFTCYGAKTPSVKFIEYIGLYSRREQNQSLKRWNKRLNFFDRKSNSNSQHSWPILVENLGFCTDSVIHCCLPSRCDILLKVS